MLVDLTIARTTVDSLILTYNVLFVVETGISFNA